jgi:cell division protein ZapA
LTSAALPEWYELKALLYYSPLIDITRGDISKAKGKRQKMDNKDSEDPVARTVRVNIFDQIYSLRSPKGEEHIRQIAEVVDERMRQISAHTTTFELSRIAVLAALNIADELQDLKSRPQERAALPAQSSDALSGAEGSPDSAPNNDETGKAQTWFEAIFDAEVPVKDRSERLSSQISNKLQTSRQDNSRDADAADKLDS